MKEGSPGENTGGPDRGIRGERRVVRGKLVQSGPVIDGYVPVQYDTVVTTSGFGNTRLNLASL